ncbi:hypothetical protein NQ317_014314, partial [Molorchus minor]
KSRLKSTVSLNYYAFIHLVCHVSEKIFGGFFPFVKVKMGRSTKTGFPSEWGQGFEQGRPICVARRGPCDIRKVVIRVEDLITWITVEAEWTWGRLAKCEDDLKNVEFDSSDCVPPRKPTGTSFTLTDSTLDFGDVENERKTLESSNDSGPHVIILSFPKYCRYRAMMKRLEDVENLYLKYKIVNALGGFYVLNPNTRVLFCKDTFDYPELEGHELLCNHLAPKLKGRPRGKRKKRSVSPCSESNESESSVSNSYNTRADHKNGYRNDSGITPRRSTRCHENNENKEFVRKLTAFMKANHTPIGRIPSLGYKELNLHEFFTKVQKLGGYDSVTTNRLWKSIFDDMSGHQNSTSAATVIRRHYERFLLPYERHVKGEEYKPLPVSERRRLKSKRGSSSISDAESNSGDSIPIPSTSRKTSLSASSTESNPKTEGKPSSLRECPEKQKEDDDKSEVKPKVEKLIIKTESMTLTTECTVKVESTPVKIENAIEKAECNTIKSESQIKPEAVPIEMKAEIIPIKSEIIPIITEVKADVSSTKAEIVPIEPITKEEIKTEVVSVKPENPKLPEKLVEPLTSAATPVAQKVPPEKISSPVEGKENIPIIKTGDTATKNSSDIMDVPYKPKPTETSVESEPYKSTFIHEVKKRKLDILKEGGLEVTPVRPPMINPIKDSRPSVIQQITPPAQIISKAKAAEIMPPPPINSVPSKRMHISVSPAVNIGQVKVAPSTPIKPARVPPTTNSFTYMNGSTPPRVVQSKSIYSYSEKTVYSGGDPVDLSVNSPQKPIVEIMRIPQTSSSSFQSPYNRDTVTKNLYKTSPSIMDGRRLGPNLEITLVGPNSNKSSVPNLKPFSFPSTQVSSPHTSSQYAAPKRFAPDYYAPNKMAKSDENGRYGKLVVPHPSQRPQA